MIVIIYIQQFRFVMQANEGIQNSTHDKTLVEAFKLIQQMKLNDLPQYLLISEFAENDKGVREPPKKLAYTPWKSHQRQFCLNHMNDIKRSTFKWKDEKEKRTFLKDRKLRYIKKNQRRASHKGVKLVRWTGDSGHKNYDPLIQYYNLKKVDEHLVQQYQWDVEDGKEPGIEVYRERCDRKRWKYRMQKYGDFVWNKQDNANLRKDARKFRNIACLEVFFLIIDDAADIAWQCVSMSPMARYWMLQIFDNKEHFNWQNFHFCPQTEEASLVIIYILLILSSMCYLNISLKLIFIDYLNFVI